MKQTICLVLTSILILALAAAGMADPEKPAPTLRGVTEYDFVGHLQQIPDDLDEEGRLLAWEGTITGDIEGIIQWWMPGPTRTGQVSHYDDKWIILDTEGNVLMAGSESGSTTVRHGKNSLWRTNGTVTEASEEFAEWIGRRVHEEGHFTWVIPGVLPESGWGTFRVN